MLIFQSWFYCTPHISQTSEFQMPWLECLAAFQRKLSVGQWRTSYTLVEFCLHISEKKKKAAVLSILHRNQNCTV